MVNALDSVLSGPWFEPQQDHYDAFGQDPSLSQSTLNYWWVPKNSQGNLTNTRGQQCDEPS